MPHADGKRGSFLGLAVGDALGAAVEFKPPSTFPPVTDYRAGGPHGLNAGEWTDDTSMALALADSIIHAGWDLNDQAARYLAWCDHGTYSVNGECFDVGITVSGALSRFKASGDARTSGLPNEDQSGNGSIMRLAPVPIRFAHLFPDDIDTLARYAIESSLPTHRSPQCTTACAYMALIIAAFINGRTREEVFASDWDMLTTLQETVVLHPLVAEIAAGSFRDKQPPEIKGTGYVIRSLEAALWALHDATDFREAVLRAVNLGNDADTTGAVCGQIAGALWGESGIPKEWLSGLAERRQIDPLLEALVAR